MCSVYSTQFWKSRDLGDVVVHIQHQACTSQNSGISNLTFHLFAIMKFEPAAFCAFCESLYLGYFFLLQEIHASEGVILMC